MSAKEVALIAAITAVLVSCITTLIMLVTRPDVVHPRRAVEDEEDPEDADFPI